MQITSEDGTFVLIMCIASILAVFFVTAFLNFWRYPASSAACHAHFSTAAKIVNVIGIAAVASFDFYRNVGWSAVFDVAYCIVAINSGAYTMWGLFAHTDVSMHVHLLALIYSSDRISRVELHSLYNKEIIIANRVPRLLELRQLVCNDGKLQVAGQTVLIIAYLFATLRFILGIPEGRVSGSIRTRNGK